MSARSRCPSGSESVGMVKPSVGQARVEPMLPAIARYVRGCGYIEIGDQEGFGFVARAIGHGGLDFEDDRPDTLAESMTVLGAGLARWFQEQGVEVDDRVRLARRRNLVEPALACGGRPAVTQSHGLAAM